MKILSFLLLGLLSFTAFGRSADDNLTLKLAKMRKAQVRSVSYDLFFDLKEGSEKFFGITTFHVELNHTKQDLTIDSMLSKIETLKVNGTVIEKFPQRKGSFDIPKKHLAKKMQIEVAYNSEFSKDGRGFKKVVDPEDKEEYLYSDFEPYHAHWLFPCFDQPDLKAVYSVKVKSPAKWTIINNELPQNEKVDGNFKMTTFHPTKSFSTYLFFLGAGPWATWEDKFEDIPLHLHARKSMAKFMDHERQFKTLKNGLKFFNDYFGYKYPFSKYGQIFVPDFLAGAMENPGAVTFNEQRFLYRGAVSSTDLENRDNTILHEMAHMWFGDLVTMEWWNDLWLNESFATYAATVAQERTTTAEFADIDFLATKNWGYWQDQLVTTHPIETAIPDVRASKGIFDGITYAKGGSALKQLHFYVGEEGFRDGLRHYFKTYAFQNTTRKNFIDSIAKASGKNLDGWTKKWLQTSGPNFVQVKHSCKDGKISSAHVVQEKSISGVMSPHRTRLGLYSAKENVLTLIKTVDVTFESAKTDVREMLGTECPDFVLPNVKDYDYALYSLDDKSVKIANMAMKNLPESLSRFQVWSILIEMVRNQKLKPAAFLEMAGDALRTEKDDVILGTLLGRWSPIRNIYFNYLSVAERKEMAPSFEKLFRDRSFQAEKKSSTQIVFFDFYISIAQSEEGLKDLATMLKKDDLDADRRWAIIKTLAHNNYPGVSGLIDEEEKKDATTLGKRYALAAKVAVPTEENKKKYFEELRPKNLVFSDLREAADNFFSVNHQELNQKFLAPFYKKITAMDWKENDDVVDIYFDRFFPYEVCTKENVRLSAQGLKKAKLTSIAKKGWLEAHDELSRCVKVIGQ